MILRLSRNIDDAIDSFEQIINKSDRITADTHLAPLATLELAICYIYLNDYVKAKKFIESGWSYSSKFLCQLYVHIRLHSAQQTIDLRKRQLKKLTKE